ncbi:MAG: hypothetical protein JW974_02585 [Alphaproteobacteria bacterium]|nr:hypothetical protein [Alphaproteobacteria bacterium]MBN2675183.1 hypothetical protein [Alphaproteobacteria bacterium]
MNVVDILLNNYIPFDDLERTDLEKFRKFVSKYGDKIYNRTPGQPTITASAFVINPDFSKTLIMHHKVHGFYKQFGGHADGNPDLKMVAIEELKDESGINSKIFQNTPIDIIRWNFPERTKDEIFYPAHDCFDIAFLFMINEDEKIKINKNEVIDTKWEKLENWRDYLPDNSVYKTNPQNFDYQQRIYKKIKLYQKFTGNLNNR